MTRFAVVQMCTCSNIGMNLITLRRHVAKAADDGAKLILFPDYCALLSENAADYDIHRERPGDGRIQNYLRNLARTYQIWIIAPGIPIACKSADKTFNLTTVIYDHKGELTRTHCQKTQKFPESAAQYVDNTATIKSTDLAAGAKVIKTPFGSIGLASKADIDELQYFPVMEHLKADIFAVFGAVCTKYGKLWVSRLKAYALQHNTIILAANQAGYHEDLAKLFYGNSMLISQTGDVLQRCKVGENILYYDH